MATKEAIEQRRRLDANDVTVDLSIDDQNVKLRFCINDAFSKKARDFIDKLRNSRGLRDSRSITKMDNAVTKLAESVPVVKLAKKSAKTAKAKKKQGEDGELPPHIRKGIQAMPITPLDWALAYIRKDNDQSQENAMIDGFMAALADACKVVLTDDKGVEVSAVGGGIFEHYTLIQYPGITLVRIRQEIECGPVDEDYFDDTEKNSLRQQNLLPNLPVRVPIHPVEQKVGLLATLRDDNTDFALQLETFFDKYTDVLMEAAFNVSRLDVDEDGFHGGDVTQTWMRRLDPLVSGPDDTEILLSERYDLIQKNFFDQDEDYRMTILGPDLLKGGSPEYWELSTFFASPVPSYEEWLSYPPELRGKLSAFHRLDNMKRIIEHHMLEMNRRMKRHLEERQKAFEDLTGTSSSAPKASKSYLGSRRPKAH